MDTYALQADVHTNKTRALKTAFSLYNEEEKSHFGTSGTRVGAARRREIDLEQNGAVGPPLSVAVNGQRSVSHMNCDPFRSQVCTLFQEHYRLLVIGRSLVFVVALHHEAWGG